MKKISLFVATLFMSLLLSVSATAQRAWAYDLSLDSYGSEYTFMFKASASGTATLVFTDEYGTELSVVELGAVEAGFNMAELSASELPEAEGLVTWAVKMEGEAISDFEIVTDASNDSYNFYLPQDVKVNNNPESEYFGTIYVAEPYWGANDGASEHTKIQTAGIYVYDQALFLENYAMGYVPSNVTLNASDKYNTLHRLAIHPLTNEVVFTQSVGAYVWAADPSDLSGEAVNMVEGLGIEMTNSVCFDEYGVMYVFDNMGTIMNEDGTTTDVGTLYKVVDGVVTAVVSTPSVVNGRNSLAADGHGGVWIGQNRSQMDEYNYLTHVNAAGEIDYEVNVNSAEDVKSMFAANMNRGHIAYDAQRDVLAIGGGGKVTLLYAEYDENGTPTLTKWTETPMLNPEKPAWNIDGLAFDYAGDLYVCCASNESFVKYAVPTENNVCVVPAASRYAFEVGSAGDNPDEPVYEVYEDEITNLVIDLDNLILIGGPSTNYAVDVFLGLGEYNRNDDTYQLVAESSVAIGGIDATFVEGYAYEVDAFAPSAKAVVRCVWNGMNIELNLTMSAAPMEATVVVVENAVVEIEKYLLWGDMYDYSLKMTGVWTNEGVDYPVLVEVPVYYPEATEPSEIMSTVTVGDMVDEDGPWLGFGEGTLTVTTVDGVVTATGIVQNPMAGVAIDITISGNLQSTGIENTVVSVKSVKTIKDGQLVISVDGVDYNATGALVK
jgi:hypothetical protein